MLEHHNIHNLKRIQPMPLLFFPRLLSIYTSWVQREKGVTKNSFILFEKLNKYTFLGRASRLFF